jgi:hypothetical protein
MAIEDVLTYEEIERERMRLTKLAAVMTLDEIRIAGARIVRIVGPGTYST